MKEMNMKAIHFIYSRIRSRKNTQRPVHEFPYFRPKSSQFLLVYAVKKAQRVV